MKKIGLVIEGGGMRGAHTAGALWALAMHGITDFHVVCATSAGACTVAFFVAHQFDLFEKVWQNYLHGRQFIRLHNLLTGRPVMDLDYLLDHVFREKEPLDLNALRTTPTLFYITATDCQTGQAHYFNNHHDPILPALKATAALPLVYRRPIMIGGRRYMDGGIVDPIPIQKALEQGCDEILVLLTRPAGFRKQPPLFPFIPKFYEKQYPALAQAIRRQHQTYNEALGRIERGEFPCPVKIIRPAAKLPISRLGASRKRILETIQRGYRDTLMSLHLTSRPDQDKISVSSET